MHCVHCNIDSFALSVPLFRGKKLSVYADIHNITEGHVLIITNDHVYCMGSLGKEFGEFKNYTIMSSDSSGKSTDRSPFSSTA
ncbi:MAG: hypothetical protein JW754_00230 [Candidatus Aenigmarchaeota archaeon]|nr:hypothetical protein [Candidatus Aenigmarchaeota archaeon]